MAYLKLKLKKKYLLDENCYSAIDQKVQPNLHNVKDVMASLGIPQGKKSWHDTVILDVAMREGYTIVTKDRGLALLSIVAGKDVIFSNIEGLHLLSGKHTKRLKGMSYLK